MTQRERLLLIVLAKDSNKPLTVCIKLWHVACLAPVCATDMNDVRHFEKRRVSTFPSN